MEPYALDINVLAVDQARSREVAALVNRAYEVEAFFVAGDRTRPAEIVELMTQGRFLVIDRDDPARGVVAAVYTSIAGDRGYFGMLAVAPDAQKRGLGRLMIDACEAVGRDAGCRLMTIKVVNLRSDLMRRYSSLGYLVAGTEPYVHRPVLQPCHFVNMEKEL